MKQNAEMQMTRRDAEHLGVRREAQRHAAFVRAGRVECSMRFVRAKAVSPLRSATAVQNAFNTQVDCGNLYGVMKKLIEIRGRVRK